MEITMSGNGVAMRIPDEAGALAPVFASNMLDASELLHIAAALAAFSWEKGGIVVEIGTYVGQTAVYMAKVLELLGFRVHVVSIDPFERFQPDSLNPQGRFADYLANISHYGVEDVCVPVAAFSEHAAPAIPSNIGLLVLDGGHHYPVVSRDLALYPPKILPGGFLFIDDYGAYYPDVVRATDEFFARAAEFVVHHKSHFVLAQRPPAETRKPARGKGGARRRKSAMG